MSAGAVYVVPGHVRTCPGHVHAAPGHVQDMFRTPSGYVSPGHDH